MTVYRYPMKPEIRQSIVDRLRHVADGIELGVFDVTELSEAYAYQSFSLDGISLQHEHTGGQSLSIRYHMVLPAIDKQPDDLDNLSIKEIISRLDALGYDLPQMHTPSRESMLAILRRESAKGGAS